MKQPNVKPLRGYKGQTPNDHTTDSHCAPYLDTSRHGDGNECSVCGVYHGGDPCPQCNGRGFHAEDCTYLGWDEKSSVRTLRGVVIPEIGRPLFPSEQFESAVEDLYTDPRPYGWVWDTAGAWLHICPRCWRLITDEEYSRNVGACRECSWETKP